VKAIVRSEYGPPDVLKFADLPTPSPEDDQVLVRIRASSINMADVDYMRGHPKAARVGTGLQRPKTKRLGLDLAGIVETVGGNVTRFQPGDEVFGDLTSYGFGAFAEYACAPERAFAPKPAGLSFEEAAVVPQAGVMALQGVRTKKGQPKPGSKVLINGGGGNVGPFAVQIAKAFGAEVTGVDHRDKLDFMRSIGADHVLDYTTQDFTKTGQRYDWILDMAPFHSLASSRRALNPSGVYLMVPGTMPQVFKSFVAAPLVSRFGSRKMGMPMWRPMDQGDIAFLTELLEVGKIAPAIDRTYPFDEIHEALRYQQEGQTVGKIAITM
jgi:NADPH:quinone reductase-like Zn-dependent oxidoreductase